MSIKSSLISSLAHNISSYTQNLAQAKSAAWQLLLDCCLLRLLSRQLTLHALHVPALLCQPLPPWLAGQRTCSTSSSSASEKYASSTPNRKSGTAALPLPPARLSAQQHCLKAVPQHLAGVAVPEQPGFPLSTFRQGLALVWGIGAIACRKQVAARAVSQQQRR